MRLPDNFFGLCVMMFIALFSLIHLGVAIGIIAPFREFHDIFRPQIGLASFNLVICFFGFLTSGLGIFALLKNADRFGRIVVLIAGGLAVFSISSLITALIINSKSLSYLNNHYTNHMNLYKSNFDSQTIIDKINDRYDCCGSNIWLDWAQAGLNTVTATSTTTKETTTTSTTTTTTITATTTMTTSTSTTTTPVTTAVPTTTVSESTSTTATTTTNVGRRKRSVEAAENVNELHHRQVRQSGTYYNSIPNLPTTFVVILPSSCCQSGAVLANSTGYCPSANNGTENKINPNGCLKGMDVTAGNHAMGIGVINCFMLVLSIIAIPTLLKSPGPYI